MWKLVKIARKAWIRLRKCYCPGRQPTGDHPTIFRLALPVFIYLHVILSGTVSQQ